MGVTPKSLLLSLLLVATTVNAQFEIISDTYQEVVIRHDENGTGFGEPADAIVLHVIQLFQNSDQFAPVTSFDVQSPGGETLFSLQLTMPTPPARRYERVLAGYRPHRSELSLCQVCEFSSYTNPYEQTLNFSADITEYFPEISVPYPAATFGGVLGGIAFLGQAGTFVGNMVGGAKYGVCERTFGVCICPKGICVDNAVNQLQSAVDENRNLITALQDEMYYLWDGQNQINLQIDQVSAAQQAAIEAQRAAFIQMDLTTQHLAGGYSELIDAMYTQSEIDKLNQLQIDNLNVAVENGFVATEILAQRTQEQLDDINQALVDVAVSTQLALDEVSILLANQSAVFQLAFNETYDELFFLNQKMEEIADRTGTELFLLNNNVRTLMEQVSTIIAMQFQESMMRVSRDGMIIGLHQLIDGAITVANLEPFIDDIGVPPTNISNADLEFTRFAVDQVTILNLVDFFGETWLYETTYAFYVNPYYMMLSAGMSPTYTELLQEVQRTSTIDGCDPGDNKSSEDNSGCTVWVERTTIRCVANADFENQWYSDNSIRILDFDDQCDGSVFTELMFEDQLGTDPTQYEIITDAEALVTALRYTAMGWDIVGSAGVAVRTPLSGSPAYPLGAFRVTSRRAGTVSDMAGTTEDEAFDPLDQITVTYPRGNELIGYMLRLWESSYRKALIQEIYRLRIGTKGTMPTGGVETQYRPFGERDPNTHTAAKCYRSAFASTSQTNAGADRVYRFLPVSIDVPISLELFYLNGSMPIDVTNEYLDNILNFDDPFQVLIPASLSMWGDYNPQTLDIMLDVPMDEMSFSINPVARQGSVLYPIMPAEGIEPKDWGFAEWAEYNGAEFYDPLSMLPTAEFYERKLEPAVAPVSPDDVVCSTTMPPNEDSFFAEWCNILDHYVVTPLGGCIVGTCPDEWSPDALEDCQDYCDFYRFFTLAPKDWSIAITLSTEENFNLVQQLTSVCPEVDGVFETSTGASGILVRNTNAIKETSVRFEYTVDPPFSCPGLLPVDFTILAGGSYAIDFSQCTEASDVVATIKTLDDQVCSTIEFTSAQRNSIQKIGLVSNAQYATVKRAELDAFNNATFDTLSVWAIVNDLIDSQVILPPNIFVDLFANPFGSPPWQAAFDEYNDLWNTHFPLLQNSTASLNFTIQQYESNLNGTVNLLDAIAPLIEDGTALLEENRRLGEQAALLIVELDNSITNATIYLELVEDSINQTQGLVEELNESVYNSSRQVEVLSWMVANFTDEILASQERFNELLEASTVITGAGWSTSSTSGFIIAIIALIVGIAALAIAGWLFVKSNIRDAATAVAVAQQAPRTAGRKRKMSGDSSSGKVTGAQRSRRRYQHHSRNLSDSDISDRVKYWS